MMVIFGPLAGMLVRRVGPKTPMVLGGILVIIAFVLPALAHGEIWQVVVSGIFTGAGIGLAFASMSNAIIESVPALQTGEGIGVNAIARTVGSSIGTAVIAALITSNSTAQGLPTDNAFTIGLWVCAGVAVLATLAAIAAPSQRKRKASALAVAG
jgi:MFS family permease